MGDGDQNRLVKSSPDNLHLAARDHDTNALDVFRMFCGKPFEQRAGIVEAQTNARVAGHTLDKWQVGMLVSAFHDVVKVANGLVRVNEQNQVEFGQSTTSQPSRLTIITRVATKGEIQMR